MITGGCQCGAVRFRVNGDLGRASICHCRMCQKAYGAFFAPLVSVRIADLVWTRGERKRFASSNRVQRGFCEACGTPLTFEYSAKWIDLSIGAFDDPAAIKPVMQMMTEHRLPWLAELIALPERPDAEQEAAEDWADSIVSHQHPDYDTEAWPPQS